MAGLNRQWDVPRRDLLDIERTAQAAKVQAADEMESALRALLSASVRADVSMRDLETALAIPAARRALHAYRAACGEDIDDATEWTPEQILANEA